MEGFWVGLVLTAVIAALIPHPSASQAEIEWSQKVCAQNGGIASLRPSGRLILPAKAECKNSAEFTRNNNPQAT